MKLNTYKQFVNENVSDEEVFSYLNHLRDSGQTNMFGAGAYIQKAFNLDKRKARDLLTKWMKSFDEAKVNEAKTKIKFDSLSIGNTYKDSKGYPVKIVDMAGTGGRWKITYQYEDGKKKTINTSPEKGINLYEGKVNEANGQTVKEFADLLAILLDRDNGMAIEKSIQEMDPKKARTLEKQISTLSKSLFKLV